MLRWIVRLLVLAVALLAIAIGVSMLASETGEVVTLRTRDPDGAVHETRLWLVDEEDNAWLRAGNPASSWLAHMKAEPNVEVERGGIVTPYRAVPLAAERDRLNARFADKYGWADAYIGMLFGRDDATPIRLDPR